MSTFIYINLQNIDSKDTVSNLISINTEAIVAILDVIFRKSGNSRLTNWTINDKNAV